MAGNMARKLMWVVACAALMVAGCDFGISKRGVGGSCRQDRECLSGLDCVNRVCAARPQAGKPETSDDEINANIPVPTLAPPATDAGVDGG